MKTNIIAKIFAAIVCSIVFASAIHAQEKFSEYKEEPVNLDALAAFADRFADRLVAEPLTMRGFINVYDNTEEAAKIKSVLVSKLDIKDRIIFYTPGIRYAFDHSSNIEFWLVPSDTELPYQPFCALCECPTIDVKGNESVVNEKNLTFTANISGSSGEPVVYKWKISAGEIIEGQGTPTIKVDPFGAKEITATVEISGVCEECDRQVSFTSKIEEKLDLIAVVGRSADEPIKMNLDILLSILKNDPTKRAYIINYGSRARGRRDFARRKWIVAQYFSLIKADTNRITLMDGGDREEEATEIWISPDDNRKPVPTPTVDRRFVETVKPLRKPRR